MDNLVPFKKESGPAAGVAPARGNDLRQQQFTNEEVSEIIRVALQTARKDGGGESVSFDDMLAIAKDFGLGPADLTAAVETIAKSQEKDDRASKAKLAFRLHALIYAVVIGGLFLIDYFSGSGIWFQFPAIALGVFLALHGIILRFAPEVVAGWVAHASRFQAPWLGSSASSADMLPRATFKIEDAYQGWAETEGLAQLEGRELVLEYDSRDSVLGWFRSRLKETRIPIDEIATVYYERGMFKTKLHLQARMMRTFQDIPGSRGCDLWLHFRRPVRPSADVLAKALGEAVSRKG